MTKEQIEGFRLALKSLSPEELRILKEKVNEEIADKYWCDENFKNREKADSYIYCIVYDDLHCFYDYLGKRAYEKYMADENAVRLEAKTKHLFPDWKVLMMKGDLEWHQKKTMTSTIRS